MPTEGQVKAGATEIANGALIDAPRLGPEAWMGLSRKVLEAAERAQLDALKGKHGLREIRQDRRGNTLFIEETEQGRAYWSDEIGGGVMVWHTALVSMKMLRIAMEEEAKRQLIDRRIEGE